MKKLNVRLAVGITMILAAASLRLVPHLPNFTPVGAMALFGGAYFTKKWQAYLLPLAALFVSDLVLNTILYHQLQFFHPMSLWVYSSFILIVLIGRLGLKKVGIKNVVFASLMASALFFILTNFGMWASDPFNVFPNNASGLIACYTAALPWAWGTFSGDLFYSAILFGVFEWAQSRFRILSPLEMLG